MALKTDTEHADETSWLVCCTANKDLHDSSEQKTKLVREADEASWWAESKKQHSSYWTLSNTYAVDGKIYGPQKPNQIKNWEETIIHM